MTRPEQNISVIDAVQQTAIRPYDDSDRPEIEFKDTFWWQLLMGFFTCWFAHWICYAHYKGFIEYVLTDGGTTILTPEDKQMVFNYVIGYHVFFGIFDVVFLFGLVGAVIALYRKLARIIAIQTTNISSIIKIVARNIANIRCFLREAALIKHQVKLYHAFEGETDNRCFDLCEDFVFYSTEQIYRVRYDKDCKTLRIQQAKSEDGKFEPPTPVKFSRRRHQWLADISLNCSQWRAGKMPNKTQAPIMIDRQQGYTLAQKMVHVLKLLFMRQIFHSVVVQGEEVRGVVDHGSVRVLVPQSVDQEEFIDDPEFEQAEAEIYDAFADPTKRNYGKQ